MRILLILFIFLCACNSVCKLSEDQEKVIEEARKNFFHYCKIEVIPCEPYYLNIHLKKKEDVALTLKLHQEIYDHSLKSGWLSLHIYDENGDFILTHHADGKRSTSVPNW